jgi:hypothetical protein
VTRSAQRATMEDAAPITGAVGTRTLRRARCIGLAVATAALALCGAAPCRGEHTIVVTSASLEAKSAPDGHATGLYRADIEFTEAHREALRDDEALVEITVLDRDGHGGRRLLEDLEDCRIGSDGSWACPRGLVFQRVAGHPPHWRLAIAFPGRSPPDAFHGPVTVRLTYSVSGGPATVHAGNIASCAPARGGPTLTCQANRKDKRRRHSSSGSVLLGWASRGHLRRS